MLVYPPTSYSLLNGPWNLPHTVQLVERHVELVDVEGTVSTSVIEVTQVGQVTARGQVTQVVLLSGLGTGQSGHSQGSGHSWSLGSGHSRGRVTAGVRLQ